MKDIVENNMKPKYISRYSPTIQNLLKEQMQQEIEKLTEEVVKLRAS